MKENKKINFTSIVVLIVFIQVIIFSGVMVYLFSKYGHCPDTLIVSFFGFMGTELGICGFLRNSSNKYDYTNNNQGGVG